MAHLKRWITGIIGVPLLIYIIGPSPQWVFQVLIILVSIIGLYELLRFSSPEMPLPLICFSFFAAYILFHLITRGMFPFLPGAAALGIIFLLGIFLFFYPSSRNRALEDIGKIFFGLFYICLPLSFLVFLTSHPKGDLWIFFLLSVIFAGDTGAFYAGRTFGKHKLYPSISPGKTWEGAIGGLFSALIAAFIFVQFFPIIKISLQLFILTACLSISGQIGDLAESMLKRNYGVKDSGNILPGHGGILDRIDALLFAIPLLYIFLSWIA